MRLPRAGRNLLLLPLALSAGCTDLLGTTDYAALDVAAVQRSGAPIPGVEFLLYSHARHLAMGATDDAGHLRFDFVPPGNLGLYSLLPPDVTTQGLLHSVAVDAISLEPGEEEAITVVLLREGDGAVEVSALTADGSPVPGTRLELYSPTGVVAEAVSGPTGVTVFDPVPFGNYGVRAVPPRGFLGRTDGAPDIVDGVLVDLDSRERVAFTFGPCRGRLVVGVQTPTGAPAADVRVLLYDHAGSVAEVRTDASGTARFDGIGCANYGVRLEPTKGFVITPGRGSSFIDGIFPTTDGFDRTFTFTVTTCRASLDVVVVDEAGQPVPGAAVTVYDFQEVIATASTPPAGTLSLDVPCANVGVRVTPPDGYTVPAGRGSEYFDGIELRDGTRAAVTFILRRL